MWLVDSGQPSPTAKLAASAMTGRWAAARGIERVPTHYAGLVSLPTLVPDTADAAPGLGGRLRVRVRQMAGDVWSCWHVKVVRRGFYGTALIALGALSPAYLPRVSPWWRLLDAIGFTGTWARLIGTAITMMGALLLTDAWLRVRPHRRAGGGTLGAAENLQAYHHLKHWAVLVIWGLPFLLAPPIFSHDAYSYAAQGWMVHNHVNPYQVGPGALPGGFADQVAWVWRYTPAPYGPLSLQIQHLLVIVCGFHPYASALAMRLPALAGVAMIGHFLPRIAVHMNRDAAFAAWFGVLNPFIVINFIGGAHNDSLMVGFVVLAIWFAYGARRRAGRLPATFWVSHGWLVGAVLVGVGAAIKQPAILAAYALPLIARPWANWSAREVGITLGRVVASFAIAIATFSAITWMTGLGFGWLNAVNVPGLVVTISPFTILGQAAQWVVNVLGLDPTGHAAVRVFRAVGIGLGLAIIAVLALTVARRRPVTFLALAYLAAAFCAPALHSWYVQWGGTLLPLTKAGQRAVRPAVWTTIVLLSYDAINMSSRNDQVALGVATLFGLVWLVWNHQRAGNRNRRTHVEAET